MKFIVRRVECNTPTQTGVFQANKIRKGKGRVLVHRKPHPTKKNKKKGRGNLKLNYKESNGEAEPCSLIKPPLNKRPKKLLQFCRANGRIGGKRKKGEGRRKEEERRRKENEEGKEREMYRGKGI